MRSNTRMLRSVLVKAVVVLSLVSVGVALADGGQPIKPGGGYAEPVVIRPTLLDGELGGGGTSYPMHLSTF